MRHLILIKVDSQGYEAGEPPPPAMIAAMEELMGGWTERGILLGAEGLRPPSEGKRVRNVKGKAKVTDGPFTEAKEVIGGFFLVKTTTADEALQLTRDVVDLHARVLGPDFVLECELRRLDGDAD
jgi:hypothetical protein